MELLFTFYRNSMHSCMQRELYRVRQGEGGVVTRLRKDWVDGSSVISDLWFDYSLFHSAEDCLHSSASRDLFLTWPSHALNTRSLFCIFSEWKTCTCTYDDTKGRDGSGHAGPQTHWLRDKMENRSFSRLSIHNPHPAARQSFNTIYLLLGNIIDIHKCTR